MRTYSVSCATISSSHCAETAERRAGEFIQSALIGFLDWNGKAAAVRRNRSIARSLLATSWHRLLRLLMRLLSPMQRDRVQLARKLEQSLACGRVQRLQRMPHGVALDDAARRHHGLGRAQAALPVFVIDQGKNARVCRGRLLP